MLAPYGTWVSPVTASAVVESSTSIDDVLVDNATATVYHIERRPSEGGRNVLVRTDKDKDVFDKDWNARTAVHEYGGGSAIVHNGVVYFSNIADGRVYSVTGDGRPPQPVTPENKSYRYANFAVHPTRQTLLVAILEDHTLDAPSTVVNSLCVIDTTEKSTYTLVSGADFYASPMFSPDGARLAWQQWFHPDMPWEGAEILCADIRFQGNVLALGDPVHVAGKKREISVSFPFWLSNSTLLFTSDQSGYQNPWICTLGNRVETRPVFREAVAQDFGLPAWILGMSPFCPLDDAGKMVLFTAMKEGRSVLYTANLAIPSDPQEVDCPYAVIQTIRQAIPGQPDVVFVGSKTDESSAVVSCRITFVEGVPRTTFATLKSTSPTSGPVANLPRELLVAPQPISLRIPPKNEPLHVVLYPPTNPDYSGSLDLEEKPPCVVNVHGGPTGMAMQGLDWRRVYFTSRGWAWLDVNYGGSSGYGRQYTDRLVGQWGVVDVEDCIQAARVLSRAPYNLVDPARIVIRGGSAGGFTVLAALSIASDVTAFAAGASSYGISDLRMLSEDTHKFESRYLDKLMGGRVDEIPEVYRQRSPVFHAEKIVAPLLILQGENDRVVPKEQAEKMVKIIQDRGGYVEYKLYPGEGHGWRQGPNMADALERELTFYEKVLKLNTTIVDT